MEYALEPDKLIHQLAAAMHSAELNWNGSTKPWTVALVKSLQSLLQTEFIEVLCSDRSSNTCEFLLDIVARKKSDQSIVLAVESEWLQCVNDVADDFCKLLVIKAPLKLMVFACNKKPRTFTREKLWEKVSDLLLKYPDHIQGERYIFMDYAQTPARHAWWIEVPANGKLVAIPDKQSVEFQ